MSGEMVFRKDCEDCGRSFLTPDRKARLCSRCAGKVKKRDQQERITTEEHPPKTSATAKASIEKRSSAAPADNRKPQVSREVETQEIRDELPGRKVHEKITRKPEVNKTLLAQMPEMTRSEIVLTKAQEQEIIGRYQLYVQRMERPPKGRRKTITAEMELPYRTVFLAVRRWNQGQSQGKNLSREERFSVEKAYFSFLERGISFSRLKERITQETGLSHWEVSRYLDLLHDGEDRLREVPDVSPEQRTAILAEYQAYLSGLVPPCSPLHALIAERTGVNPKQVHKVLVAYRLGRFRERWS